MNGKIESVMQPPDFAGKFEQYFLMLYSYFGYRGETEEDANDLAAAAMERALSRLHTYDAQKGTFSAWLLAIARNLGVNEWKKRKNIVHVSIENADRMGDRGYSAEELAVRIEERQLLRMELNKLEARERELVALKFAGRMTNREIARFTGYSESNVGVILYRALQRLHAGMVQHEEIWHE